MSGEENQETIDKYAKELIKALNKNGLILVYESEMVITLPKMDCFDNMNGYEVTKAIEDAGFKWNVVTTPD